MATEPTKLHTKRNVGGRPPERGESKRAPISMRTTPAIRASLEEAAERGGRSLAQEIEQRLERSVEVERQRGGPATAALIARFLADIAEIEDATGTPWHKDIKTYGAVRAAIMDELANVMPVPDDETQALRDAEAAQHGAAAVAEALRFIRAGAIKVEGSSLEEADAIEADYADKWVQPTKALLVRLDERASEGAAIFERLGERRAALRAVKRRQGRGA